jgi:hypothetical protein
MMKIEDQVCSPKQGCKLKGLHVKAIPHYIWEFANKWHLCEWRILEDWIPAYTVAELGVLLPINNSVSLPCAEIWKDADGWYYDACGDYPCTDRAYEYSKAPLETEAQAKAEALIWLLENNYLKAEDLKL